MCGIAGILRVWNSREGDAPSPQVSIPDSWLATLDDAIAPRGPDGQGTFRDRTRNAQGQIIDVALIHRRLSIIDHATGAQPMTTGAATSAGSNLLALVFNGCIYNHRALREELRAAGRTFTTDHSDTEVILHAHAAWGADAPSRLDGMFAYALWNRAATSLTLARDAAGEKPLYELHASPMLRVFASTPGALLAWHARHASNLHAPGAQAEPLRINPSALAQWLRFGASLHSPWTTMHEVPPRSTTTCFAGTSQYATLPSRAALTDPVAQGAGAQAQLDNLLRAAVLSRLEADVPLACFLSGGLDSALIAHHARAALGSLTTLCVRMPDARYDESADAAHTAKLLGTTHHTLDCDARPAEHLQLLISRLALPFADSSLLPTYWVSQAARQHAKVALSGDGGDELFGGYQRHTAPRLLARWSPLLRHIPRWLGASAHPTSRLAKLARLARAARATHEGYLELLALFPREMLRKLAPDLPADSWLSSSSLLADPLRADFDFYLPADLLRKTDTASMAVPLEVRSPFLAHDLVHAALSTPLETLMPQGERKGLLKQIARQYLSAEVIARPKRGFAIPVSEWFRSDFGSMRSLLHDTLSTPDPFPSEALGTTINRQVVRTLLHEQDAGNIDHGQRLYALLVLALWCRTLKRLS